MRAKVATSKKHRARGVSLPPEVEEAALKKAFSMDVSFSKYIQRLIKRDTKWKAVSSKLDRTYAAETGQ